MSGFIRMEASNMCPRYMYNEWRNILHPMTRKECLPSLLQACCWPSFQVGPSGKNQVRVKLMVV